MASSKQTEKTFFAEVDSSPLRASSRLEAIERASKSRDYIQAWSLLQLLGSDSLSDRAGSAQDLLFDALSYLKYAPAEKAKIGEILGWCEALVSFGADPFACKGEVKSYTYFGSFFEAVLDRSMWAFAKKLAQADKEKALAAINRGCSNTHFGESSSKIQIAMLEGGVEAIELGLGLGMDPNEGAGVHGPWVFGSKDAKTLACFAKSGADLEKRDYLGRSLEECFAQIANAKMRQAMLGALRDAKASKPAKAEKTEQERARELSAFWALASHAGPCEFKESAARAKIDWLAECDGQGRTSLGVALSRANWTLALDLVSSGCDPLALMSNGLPMATCVFHAFETGLSKASKSKDQLKKECVSKMIEAIPVALAGGKPILEQIASAFESQKFSYEALSQWFDKEPLDVQRPLWRRLADMGQGGWMVCQAARCRNEPWSVEDGQGLLSYLLCEQLPEGYVSKNDEWKYENHLEKFIRGLDWWRDKGMEAASCLQRLFEPLQISQAFEQVTLHNRGAYQKGAEAFKRLNEAIGLWDKAAAARGVEPFDFQSLSAAIASLAQNGGSQGNRQAEEISQWLCSKHPSKAGVLFFDLLAFPDNLGMCKRLWRRSIHEKNPLLLPDSHNLLSKSGAVQAFLANDPLWLEIEGKLLEQSAPKPVSLNKRL